MTLTPREIAAWLELNDRLDRMDRANDMLVTAVGSQGDQKALDKVLKELTS